MERNQSGKRKFQISNCHQTCILKCFDRTVFQEKTQATLSHSVPSATLQSSRFAIALAIESTLSRTSATVYVWPVKPQVYGLRECFNGLRPCFSEYMNSPTVMLSGRGTGGSARAQAGDSKTMMAFNWVKGTIGKTLLLRLQISLKIRFYSTSILFALELLEPRPSELLPRH